MKKELRDEKIKLLSSAVDNLYELNNKLMNSVYDDLEGQHKLSIKICLLSSISIIVLGGALITHIIST